MVAQAKEEQRRMAKKWVAQAKDLQLPRARGVDQKEEREVTGNLHERSQQVVSQNLHGRSQTLARPENLHERFQPHPPLPFLLRFVADLNCAQDLLGSASHHCGTGHLQVRTLLAGPNQTDVSVRPRQVVLVSLFASET